ncbi:MAG: iron chelate uptake ABC transporter family permease subunit, partial [Bacteroidota bacterium]
SISGAIVSVLQFFSSAEELQIFVVWTMGSLGGLTWEELIILSIVVIIGLSISISQIKPLNAFLLTENYARTLGINIRKEEYGDNNPK